MSEDMIVQIFCFFPSEDGIPGGEESDDSDEYRFDSDDSNEMWFAGPVPRAPARPRYPHVRSELVHVQLLPDEFVSPTPFPIAFLRRLKKACEDGDLSLVQQLLERRPDAVNAKMQGSLNPLMIAAIYGDAPLVDLLLSSGARVHDKSYIYGTALHCALCGFRDEEAKKACLDRLLEGGANVEARDPSGYTPFLVAADLGNLELLKYVRAKGANVKVKGMRSRDAFEVACAHGHEEILRYLHDEGVEGLPGRDKDSVRNYLRTARGGGFEEIVRKYVNLDALDGDEAETVGDGPEGGDCSFAR
jgi:hypothetical protein